MLTILTVIPSELGPSYTRLYRQALLRWNREGLADTQIIFLPQRQLKPDEADGFEVVKVEYESVGGYPVWDLMKTVRKAWPLIKGDYVAFDHPEFIWGPGRLDKTIGFLEAYRPICALGNLRRPGELSGLEKTARDTTMKQASAWFRKFLDADRWDEAAECSEHIQTSSWMYWLECQKPGPNFWLEDVFFADKGWLDAWGFARWDPEMPFQDVYDLMQMAARTLTQYGLHVVCQRMPQSVNRVLHLWHPRTWSSFTPAMRDWFLSQPERWKRSAYGDPQMWADLIEATRDPLNMKSQPVTRSRFGPRGTAVNYGAELMRWLADDGVEVMHRFFEERRERLLEGAA